MAKIRPGVYRHYKGREYDVYGEITPSSNANVSSASPIVVYRSRYGDRKLYGRPQEEFLENVPVDGAAVPRFVFVREFDDPCLVDIAKFFSS